MLRAFFFLLILLGLLMRWPLGGASPVEGAFDLGVARYPAAAGTQQGPAARTTRHVWRTEQRVPLDQVGYAHGLSAGAALEADHARLGERFGFRRGPGDRFRWNLPSSCEGREWGCIYTAIRDRGHADLVPLLDRIAEEAEARAEEEAWTAGRLASWLLAFVQAIPYEIPRESAFGVLPPPLVVSWARGDCDSKSLLLMELLDRVGIDSVLLISEAHAHAMVGVAVASGVGARDRLRYRGRDWVWAETTAEDAPLGWRHPKMRLPDDWRVVALP